MGRRALQYLLLGIALAAIAMVALACTSEDSTVTPTATVTASATATASPAATATGTSTASATTTDAARAQACDDIAGLDAAVGAFTTDTPIAELKQGWANVTTQWTAMRDSLAEFKEIGVESLTAAFDALGAAIEAVQDEGVSIEQVAAVRSAFSAVRVALGDVVTGLGCQGQ